MRRLTGALHQKSNIVSIVIILLLFIVLGLHLVEGDHLCSVERLDFDVHHVGIAKMDRLNQTIDSILQLLLCVS